MKRTKLLFVILFSLVLTNFSFAQNIFSLLDLEGVITKNDTLKITQLAKKKGYQQLTSGEEVFLEGWTQPKFVNSYIDNQKNYLEYDALGKTFMYVIKSPTTAIINNFNSEISKNYKKFSTEDIAKSPILKNWFQNKSDYQISVNKFIGDFLSMKNALIINLTFINMSELMSQAFEEDATEGNAVLAKSIGTNKLEINSMTNATTINVKKGDKLYLKATGQITFGAWAGSGNPNGIDGYTSYNRVSGFRHGSLLAKIGDGEYFSIGTYKVIVAQSSGKLQLLVNDGDPSNNSGSFTVQYSINKAISPD